MSKIIIKSALITLAVVAGCAVAVFGILSLGFPGTLCGWCEQLGNYGFAARYASLYYAYTGNIADLGRCVEDSILAGDDGYVIKYCPELVDHGEFADYCALRDENINGSISGNEGFSGVVFSYRQYTFGALASAYYREGETELALGTAVSALDADVVRGEFASVSYSGDIYGFPVNNALGSLALRVIENKDPVTGQSILDLLERVTAVGGEQTKYLDTLKSALSGVIAG